MVNKELIVRIPPRPQILPISAEEWELLVVQGYVGRRPLFHPEFADAFPREIDRLIGDGIIQPARDRIVDDQPTEWIANLGTISGNCPDSEIFRRSPFLRRLFNGLREFGESYNAIRQKLLKGRKWKPDDLPELTTFGMELNVNRVIGTPNARWSGLHQHRDTDRFTDLLRALPVESVRHAAVGANGRRGNDPGGALTFQVRDASKNPGDRTVFDVVTADHNSGAFFFPGTVHGVARMTPGGGVRYSFQAFYPCRDAWQTIEQRIAAGELRDELETSLKLAA